MKLRSLLLLTALAGASVAVATGAGAAGETIQPGVFHVTNGSGCTFNFVYDGVGARAGKTYIGTAAHCVAAVGDDVALDSGEVIGDVAVLGDEGSTEADWALVEVRPEFVSRVSPAVKGHPSIPKGITSPSEVGTGDLIQLSGYGLGFDMTTQTQERRQAVLGFQDGEIYTAAGPILFGDSGGPLVHVATGKAIGIVSRLCIGACTDEGATVEAIIAKAAEAGFPVKMRTV